MKDRPAFTTSDGLLVLYHRVPRKAMRAENCFHAHAIDFIVLQ
jgi:hypothetical protein